MVKRRQHIGTFLHNEMGISLRGISPMCGRSSIHLQKIFFLRSIVSYELHSRGSASVARSSGKTSFMDRTPLCTLKASVSCASIDVPEYQPTTGLRPEMSSNGDTASDSGAARTTDVPRTPNPPRTALIASPLVTVARITPAPPKLHT